MPLNILSVNTITPVNFDVNTSTANSKIYSINFSVDTNLSPYEIANGLVEFLPGTFDIEPSGGWLANFSDRNFAELNLTIANVGINGFTIYIANFSGISRSSYGVKVNAFITF